MKTHYFINLSMIALLILGINVQVLGGITYANTINVPTAGTLSSILTQQQKDTITSLKLTGFLNSTDFSTIRNNVTKLKYLDISVATISNNKLPSSAFSGKSTLEDVVLPDVITEIGYSSFYNCTSLKHVNFPSNLTTIKYQAFYGCTSLSGEIIFPSQLTTIEYTAFYNCKSLTKVTFPEGLLSIGESAFSGCSSLSGELTLPASLTSIEGNAFYNCSSLTKVNFKEGLQSIKSYAFQNCYNLTGELTLPSTITSVEYYAFNGCNKLTTCKALATTPPTLGDSYSIGNVKVVYVPETAVAAYKAANYWKTKIIIGGNSPKTVEVNVTTAGTLGEKLLEHVTLVSDVNILKVSGTLNSTDFNRIKNDMTSLISVDMSGCTNTELPDQLFYGKSGLLEVKLPANLKKIGSQTFYGCYALSVPEFPSTLEEIKNSAFYYCYNFYSIDFPNSLKTLGNSAFDNCTNLVSITLPNSLTTIGNAAFASCHSLQSVVIPNSVTSIGNMLFYSCYTLTQVIIPDHITRIEYETFYNCSSLLSIDLPTGLTYLGSDVFRNCVSLNQITLPSGLITIESYYGAFYNCTNLQKITCLQPTPPILSSDPFGYIDKSKCELVVPLWGETMYKLADYWKQFTNITTYNEEIAHLPINSALTLSSNIRPLGTPSVTILQSGSLTVNGNTPFNTNEFVMNYNARPYYYWEETGQFSSLISECNSMTAQYCKLNFQLYGNRWYYFSFPFDVKLSDITIDQDIQYVFREYDGSARATSGSGNSWKNLTNDTIRAGKGYIFQCSNDVSNLVLNATNASKNRLFEPDAKSTQLKEYAAQNAANKNWNFVGNPYPSYFDIRCIDYTAPITVWNRDYSRYDAYSPVDDEFILRPYEAFFVQKPADLEAITFRPAGRQMTSEIQERTTTEEKLRAAKNTDRILINLMLKNQELSDKSRIVINPTATLNYDMECDAAKFMSTDNTIPQLYSIDNSSVNYAINERPLNTGIIPLGYYAGATDLFTIALSNETEGMSVDLIDKTLNRTTNLNESSYAFNSDAGKFDDRFVLRIGQSTTNMETGKVSAIKVTGSEGSLVIENAIGKTFNVYTSTGSIVASGSISSDTETKISLAQGVYIVAIGKEIFKAVVF